MLKLFLCLLIVFSGALVGLHLSQRLTKRREILTQLSAMFHRAETLIAYRSDNLCEVFGGNFADYPFTPDEPFDTQWRQFIGQFGSLLSDEDRAVLMQFGDGLGSSDADSQQKHFSLCETLLNERIDAVQKEIGEKSKLCRVLPLSAGLAVALLLL